LLALIAWCACAPIPVRAATPAGVAPERNVPDGVHVTDGSFVLTAGQLQVNISNFGMIGSRYSTLSDYSHAPSAQWPGGSGNEYLYCAGLWIGAVQLGETLCSTGQFERELRPRPGLEATMYESMDGKVTRPLANPQTTGRRHPSAEADDDDDERVDEEILNGLDDDTDGAVDEDIGQIGNQMIVCTMYDNTRVAAEEYPDHNPLNLEIVQRAIAWESPEAENFVGFQFDITNVGVIDLNDVYIGLFADCDIGPRGVPGAFQDDMAGFYEGIVRARNGSYVSISVGYMYDAAEQDALPGYIGVLFLGDPFDPGGRIRSFQSFSQQQPFLDGGDPTSDDERYILLSAEEHDRNTPEGRQNDFRFLVSAGPYTSLTPHQTIRFNAALVVGDGFDGMLQVCAEAAQTFAGSFFDVDNDPLTGVAGRETKLCVEDLPTLDDGTSWLYNQVAASMDRTCVGMSTDFITPDDLFIDASGKHCVYVNMDNCFECERITGEPCTVENGLFAARWNCDDGVATEEELVSCTGVLGKETNVDWIVSMAPPPPAMRLWPRNNAVHIYWNDLSEHSPDLRHNEIDFESYRLWRADNWDRPFGSSLENGPQATLWDLIAEFDLVSHYWRELDVGDNTVRLDSLALGSNTGFDGIRYTPACLFDARFAGLEEAMQDVVDADVHNRYRQLPPLRQSDGTPNADLVGLLYWESYPAVLDTFFWTTQRDADPVNDVIGKRAVGFYEYVDHDVHNGFLYFYSIVATDHQLDFHDGAPLVSGAGQAGSPNNAFAWVSPAPAAQSADERKACGSNIYVYPNPATRQSLAEFQQLHPNEDDPTGVRVVFANLPEATNTIRIFTLAGDLIERIEHDGSVGYGQTSWNLVSNNGQEIVSGVYLYAVESADTRFEDHIGKFVVIR